MTVVSAAAASVVTAVGSKKAAVAIGIVVPNAMSATAPTAVMDAAVPTNRRTGLRKTLLRAGTSARRSAARLCCCAAVGSLRFAVSPVKFSASAAAENASLWARVSALADGTSGADCCCFDCCSRRARRVITRAASSDAFGVTASGVWR